MIKKFRLIFLGFLVSLFLGSSVALAASISLIPSSGTAGASFTISGTGFTASTGVDVTWDSGGLTGGTADGSGNVSISAMVPGSATAGDHTVRVASLGGVGKAEPRWHFWKKVFALGVGDPPSAQATFTVITATNSPSPSPSESTSSPSPSTSTSSASPSPSSSVSASSPSPSSSTGTDLSNTTTVKGTANSVDKSKSKIETDKTSVVNNGQDVATISLILMDSKGRVVEGLTPEITVSGSDNTLSAVEYKDKKYTATLSSTKAEEKTVSAKVSSKDLGSVKINFNEAVTETTTPTASSAPVASSTKCSTFWSCWWWLILLIFLLIIVILAVYVYYKNRKEKENDS